MATLSFLLIKSLDFVETFVEYNVTKLLRNGGNMTKQTKVKTTTTKKRRRRVNFSYQELWKNGTNHRFHSGDVVRSGATGTGNIGIVLRPVKEIGKYDVKWHTGTPNLWDGVLGSGFEGKMVKVDEPNPFDIKTFQRYPGPSSDTIQQFEMKLKAKKELEKANLTTQDIEKNISILEEEIKKRKNIKTEEDVDIISTGGSFLDGDDDGDRDVLEYENEVLYDKIKRDLSNED